MLARDSVKDKMVGKTISHYKVLERLGGGGMGVVYRAEDLKLKRSVALKFLPSELTWDPAAKERFVQEAQAASGLDHTNICNIHEIDQTEDGQIFMVLTYYEGETLKRKIRRGPLKLVEAIDIAVQVAQGLVKAHEMGIIHRDIKPANLVITKDGVVKIVDFGLAKLAGETRLTVTGAIMGTVAYMSPEQARGEEVDHRSDIWSLGVVLYEMLAGQLPFRGEYEQAVLYSILNEDPEPLSSFRSDIPSYLEEVIQKALDKEPANRYQNVRELLQDLKMAGTSGVTFPEQEKSIAVLPFEDISPGKDNEYFSDGLTEEIITDLSQIQELRVISRTSSMLFKGTRKPARTIARELNVRYVLEGSVRKAGNDLRITAQLINPRNDRHLWAAKYKGTLDDVLDIQEKVSRSIVDALRLKLSPREEQKMAERPIDNAHAHECYLRAKQEIWIQTENGLERALHYLQNGLDIVGENAVLYAGMGYVYWQYVNLGFRQEDYVNKAEECVKKAFELDPESSQGHLILALINQAFRGNQQQAVRHFKRALATNPNDLDALIWLSLGYGIVGKPFAAIPLAKKALEIDPLNSVSHRLPGVLHFYEGRFDLAVESFSKAYQMDPENPAHFWYALVLAYNKRFEEAYSVIDHGAEVAPQHFYTQLGILLERALKGEKKDISQLLTPELKNTAERDVQYSSFVATIYAILDDKKNTLDWLENAVNRGFVNYPLLSQHDPFLENIRKDKRFKQLMERVKYEWENFEV
jgi:non-specific serine/threonine protein kinase